MTPVQIARQALHRLAELGLPPTPENYEAEYRAIAGLPPRSPPRLNEAPAPAHTVEMIRALLQLTSDANAGLQADLTRFSQDSNSLLAELERSEDPKATDELFRAMTQSSTWLLRQVDNTRQELERTRAQLDQVHGQLENAQALAVSDALTGLANRRGLDAALSRELSRARRTNATVCLAVIDIDHFKRINDQHGHVAGDLALVHLAQVLGPAIRETDVLARFGGEEFVLVMPDTPLVGAEFMLNRLLRTIARAPLFIQDMQLPIAFSVGVAQWQAGESAAQLIHRADQAMYQAKAAGRARVAVAEPGEALPAAAGVPATSS